MADKISLVQAAKLLPQSEETLRILARSGRIKAQKLGRDWYITTDEIERLQKAEEQESGV